MSEIAYQAGLKAFTDTFAEEEAGFNGSLARAAGRATAKEDKAWWIKNGPSMVFSYYQWRQANPNLVIWHTPDGVPAIELECNITLPDGTVLKAFIDRVFEDRNTGQLLIVDLKSGKTTPATALQLAVYRLCIEETFGVSPKHGAYWMARGGTLDAIHDLERIPPVMVSRWLRDVKKAIDLRLFVPHLTRDCASFCGVREHCYTQNPAVPTPDFTSDIG